MCSGSEVDSYVRLIAFVYHSTLGLRRRIERTAAPIADVARVEARYRYNRLRALLAPRPQTVGYVAVCDQEQGVIKSRFQKLKKRRGGYRGPSRGCGTCSLSSPPAFAVSLSLRLKDLLGLVTRVKKKKKGRSIRGEGSGFRFTIEGLWRGMRGSLG